MNIPNSDLPSLRPTPRFFLLCCTISVVFSVFTIINTMVVAFSALAIIKEALFLPSVPETHHLDLDGMSKMNTRAKKPLRGVAAWINEEEMRVEQAANIKKPIMYTFYEPVEEGCCGMTKEGHDNLVAFWKKAWEDKGWETRVLTGDDAKRYEYFDQVDNKLASLGVSEYDRRCFWRWFAMIMVGGGWMSDYDTFPLELDAERGIQLSVSGKFKSFGRQVPCLIHASGDEWERVLHDMIRMLPRVKSVANPNGYYNGEIISDMILFNNLGESGTAGELWDNNYVAKRFSYQSATDESKLAIDCEAYWGQLAAHLSHVAHDIAIEEGKFPLTEVHTKKEAVERRADAALVLMDDFKNECMQQAQ